VDGSWMQTMIDAQHRNGTEALAQQAAALFQP
jgi:hypothetical protein